MGFNSKRFISTRYFSSTLFIHTSLPLSLSYFSHSLFSPPSIYFSKKVEKAARKNFSGRKGKKKTATEEQKNRRTTQSVEDKKNKSRCGRKEENTGDEKGFSTFLWSFATFSLFFFTPCWVVWFFRRAKIG